MPHVPVSRPRPGDGRGALGYAAALLAVAAALLLSELLRPLVLPSPFLLVYGAIALSASYGGLGPGLLATALAVFGVNYLFIPPVYNLSADPPDLVRLGVFAAISVLVSGLSNARRRAEQAAAAGREQLQVTLASIGDAVITTDTDGRLTFLNDAAAGITGWTAAEASGRPIEEVFRIINAHTRQAVESPVARVLREGVIVGLANHTVLLSRDGGERPIDDSGAPIRDGEGRLLGVVLVFRDVSERDRSEAERALLLAREQAARAAAERANERLAFLADVSAQLVASLDYDETLRRIARLCVPRLADWCVIDTPAPDGTLAMQIVAHADPAKERWALALRERYPVTMDMPAGSPLVIRSGEPLLIPAIPDELLVQAARDEEELRLLRLVGYRSSLIVPLRVHDRIIGSLGFVAAESGRSYTADDVTLAEEIARRAGAALDNARLYQAARQELAQRQRAEAALRASEGQLRLIADALPVLISYLDRDLHYRFNNQAYEQWFGLSRAAVTGRHIREVVGEAAYAQLRPHLEATLAGSTVSFETLSPYRSGGVRFIHATYIPDHDEDGGVRGLVVLVEDISARKRAEEGQRLLVDSGTLLASSLDYETTLQRVARLTVPSFADYTVVYLLEEGGRIARTANAHRSPDHEALLIALAQRYPVDPEGAAPVARVLRSGRPLIGEGVPDELLETIAQDAEHLRILRALGTRSFLVVPLEVRGRTQGAMLCGLSGSGRVYDDSDLRLAGELAYRAALAIDNAGLYRAASQARDTAEEAVRLRELFLSVASHELKTPLTSLLLQTQLLERRLARGGGLSERDERLIKLISNQAQRLDRMIAALLDISRLERGQLRLNVAPLDLGALAQRAVSELQPTSDAHTITFQAPATAPTVLGDELRLEQVLQNLIQNAIKYSPEGGPVEVAVDAEGGRACVSVCDRGIGVPEEALPFLFERFYRASNADPRQISGMGIGLYVVREIVGLHGGSVRAEGREGGGSCFTVCLPLCAGGAGAAR